MAKDSFFPPENLIDDTKIVIRRGHEASSLSLPGEVSRSLSAPPVRIRYPSCLSSRTRRGAHVGNRLITKRSGGLSIRGAGSNRCFDPSPRPKRGVRAMLYPYRMVSIAGQHAKASATASVVLRTGGPAQCSARWLSHSPVSSFSEMPAIICRPMEAPSSRPIGTLMPGIAARFAEMVRIRYIHLQGSSTSRRARMPSWW